MSNLETIISREPQVCFTQISADEIVILNAIDDSFYHFNESAVDLWLALDTPKQIVELAFILAKKYDGHADNYKNDVIEWVDDAIVKGLLVKTNE